MDLLSFNSTQSRVSSEFNLYSATSYESGLLLRLLFIFLVVLSLGFCPQYMFGIYEVYWQSIYTSSSANEITLVTSFILLYSIFFHALHKFLDFSLDVLSLRQATYLRNMIYSSLDRQGLQKLYERKNLGQVILSPDDFYQNVNVFIKKFLYSIGVIVGSITYLSRYGLGLMGFYWSSCVFAINWVLANDPACKKNNLDKSEKVLLDDVRDLSKSGSFFVGQMNFLRTFIASICESSNREFTRTSKDYVVQKSFQDFTMSLIQRLITPLATLLLIWIYSFHFPLKSVIISPGAAMITVGSFTQISTCVTTIWNYGSIYKDYIHEKNKLQSSFLQIQDHFSIYNLQLLRPHQSKKSSSLSYILFYQVLLIFFTLTTSIVVADVLRFFALQNFPLGVFPSMGILPFFLSGYILYIFNHNRSDVNWFAVSFATAICIFLYQGSYYLNLLSFDPLRAQFIGLCIFSILNLLGCHLANNYYRDMSQKRISSVSSYKSKSAKDSLYKSNSIMLKDLKLCKNYLNQSKPVDEISMLQDSEIVLQPNRPCVVCGENGTGKSSMVINSLRDESSQESSGINPFIKGFVHIPVKRENKLIFDQVNKPLENIALFKRNNRVCKDGQTKMLDDLQSIFYSIALESPSNLSLRDRALFDNWGYYRGIILDFLDDCDLRVEPSLLLSIKENNSISSEISGVSATKLLVACIYAVLHSYEHINAIDESFLLAIDEGFAMDQAIKTVLLTKLCTFIKESSAKIFYLHVLHDASQHKLFTKKIYLSRQADNKIAVQGLDISVPQITHKLRLS